MKQFLEYFSPNHVMSRSATRILIAAQAGILLLVWVFANTVFLPKPGEVLNAFIFLWTQEGLGGELVTSFLLNVQAVITATIISLLLAYLSVLPFFRPMVALTGKLRFVSLIGLTFFFTMLATTGHELKLYLLVFSVTVFFVVGMCDVIGSIPKENYDLARTLGMNEWRTTLEVVVLGQADKAFDVARQNGAMSWLLLSMVEGISRSGGGIGAMLIDQNKHFHLDAVFAIQITILLLGLGQDYAIGLFRRIACPYADLAAERK